MQFLKHKTFEDGLKKYDLLNGVLRTNDIKPIINKKQESNKLLKDKYREYDFLNGLKTPDVVNNTEKIK